MDDIATVPASASSSSSSTADIAHETSSEGADGEPESITTASESRKPGSADDPKAEPKTAEPKTDEEWFQYAASLTPIEYDRQRESMAELLGIRVSTLDDELKKRRPTVTGSQTNSTLILREPEPWAEPVNGAELLRAIQAIFEKHVILPKFASVLLALWTLHTYLLEVADVTPYLGITSPEKRCGKTIVLEILQELCDRPLPASNITAAGAFRTIERYAPTLLIDEADTFFRNNPELMGILNSGHRRVFAKIIRLVGDNHEPKGIQHMVLKSDCAHWKAAEHDRGSVDCHRHAPENARRTRRAARPWNVQERCRTVSTPGGAMGQGQHGEAQKSPMPGNTGGPERSCSRLLVAVAHDCRSDWRGVAAACAGRSSEVLTQRR
jgi:hypothetical protein